jgi:hypothetical protein
MWARASVAVIVAMGTGALACKSKSEPDPAEADESAAASSGAIADDDAQPGDGNSAHALPPAHPLPPIDLEIVAEAELARARELNQAGLDAQRAERYDEAIEHYHAALAADPGHLTARYNLATAYNLAGDSAAALAILEALGEVDDCPVCVGRLARAREDDDFASLHDDPAFERITGDAEVPRLSAEAAAEQVLDALMAELDARWEALGPLIHPRRPVTIEVTVGACEPEEGVGDCRSSRSLVGHEAVASVAGEWFPLEAEIGSCEGDCCEITTTEQTGGDMATQIETICTTRDSGGVSTLSRLVVIEGP